VDEATTRQGATAGDAVPLRLTADAVARAFQRIQSQLLASAIHHGVPREDARDLIQDAALKILERLDHTPIRSAEAYVRTTVANLIVDWHRSPRNSRGTLTGWTDDENEAGSFERLVDKYDRVEGNRAEQLDRAECIERVLHEIEATHKLRGLALELAFHGVSGRDMAEPLNKSPAAANEFLSSTRKLFERLVREHCEEDFNRD
jgi:DNA-directed RNA polymerase specialized sigma24 family protein